MDSITLKIPLACGGYFLISGDDLPRVCNLKWTLNNEGYVVTLGKRERVLLTSVLLQVPRKKVVDHKNRNRTDNRRKNLRIATRQQNSANTPGRSRQRKGVSAAGKNFSAKLCTYHIGTFTTAESAARAYDIAAHIKYGEFALLNFPGEDIPDLIPIGVTAAALSIRSRVLYQSIVSMGIQTHDTQASLAGISDANKRSISCAAIPTIKRYLDEQA